MSADSIARWTLLGYVFTVGLLVLWRAIRCPEGWRRWMLYLIASLYCRLGFHWRANRPCPFLEARPGILIANHRSPTDPLLIWVGVTNCRPLGFLTAREYFGTSWALDFIFREQGSIPVARDGKDMAATRAALRRLQEKHLVGVFPEGKINTGPGLLPANPGIAWLALQSEAPVYPVFIENAPQGMGMVDSFWHFTQVRIIYGDAVDLSIYYGRKRTPELLQEVTDVLMSRLSQLGGLEPNAGDARRSEILPMNAVSA